MKVTHGAPLTPIMISPGRMAGSHINAGFGAPSGNSLKRCTTVLPLDPFDISKPMPCGPFKIVVTIILTPSDRTGATLSGKALGALYLRTLDEADNSGAVAGAVVDFGASMGANFDFTVELSGTAMGAYFELEEDWVESRIDEFDIP